MVLWNISRPFADRFSTWMARALGRFFGGIANQTPNKTGIDTCIIMMMMMTMTMMMMMMMMMLIIIIIISSSSSSIMTVMMITVLTMIITIGSTTQHKNMIFDAQQWDNGISTVSCVQPLNPLGIRP